MAICHLTNGRECNVCWPRSQHSTFFNLSSSVASPSLWRRASRPCARSFSSFSHLSFSPKCWWTENYKLGPRKGSEARESEPGGDKGKDRETDWWRDRGTCGAVPLLMVYCSINAGIIILQEEQHCGLCRDLLPMLFSNSPRPIKSSLTKERCSLSPLDIERSTFAVHSPGHKNHHFHQPQMGNRCDGINEINFIHSACSYPTIAHN